MLSYTFLHGRCLGLFLYTSWRFCDGQMIFIHLLVVMSLHSKILGSMIYEIVSLKFVDIDHQNRLEKQSHLCVNYWKDCQQPSWIWRPIRFTHSMKLYDFCLIFFFLSLFTALVVPILPLGIGNNLGLCYYIRWGSWFKQKVTHKGVMSTCKSWWNCQIRLEFFSPKSFANGYYVGFWAGFVTVNDCSIAEMGRNNWSGSPECWIFKGPRSCESSFKHTTGMDGICTVSNWSHLHSEYIFMSYHVSLVVLFLMVLVLEKEWIGEVFRVFHLSS